MSGARIPLRRLVELRTERAQLEGFKVGLENLESWTGRFVTSESVFEGDGVAFKSGDVLFGKLRPYLAKAWVADRAGAAVGDFFVLRPRFGTDPRFIRDVLLSPDSIEQLSAAVYGSKMPRAAWESVGALKVAVVSIEAQRAAVDWTEGQTAEIDAFIADQEQLIALLEERQEAEVASRLATESYPLRPLKSGAVFVGGGTPDTKQDDYWSGQDGIPWVSISDFVAVGEGRAPVKKVTRAGLTAARLRPSTKSTLLFAMYASVGATAIVQPPAVWNQAIIGINPTGANSLDYLHFALRALRPSLKMQFRSNTQDNVNLEQVRNLLIPLPSVDMQYQIAKDLQQSLQNSHDTIADARKAIALSKERRAALISAAVTGSIDVTGRKRVLV